ncbi:MAG: hypothetical protein J6U54_12705 [Clostridiales bacterium]|nr:hypothetical protein [Clostridiales bacterium]
MITAGDIVLVWVVSIGAAGLLYLACIVSPAIAKACDKFGDHAERLIGKFADPILDFFGLNVDDDEED